MSLLGLPLTLLADASAASSVMRSYVTPTVVTLCGLASLACVFFLVMAGIQYMTSSGNPEKLDRAKRITKNAIIGLVLVIAATTLTAILAHAYSSSGSVPTEKFPTLQPLETKSDSISLWDVLIKAVVGLLRNIVESVGEPFLKAISYFINGTPLMAQNSSVFNLWLAMVGISDVLFVLVVALVGFKVMSLSTFGFDDIDIKQLLPQFALVFLLVNTSIFAIDMVIELSNAMIRALQSAFVCTDVWQTLADITKKSSDLGVAGLLVMVAFLVLTVMLLVYYVLRLVTLYIGAILSPVVMLLSLVPGFKDFAITALKTYLTTIFVLFVHVVIMMLASSIFTGMLEGNNNGQPNTLMALIVGLATVVALLRTQGFMQELSYAASAPRAARELSGSFIRGVSYINKGAHTTKKAAQSGKKSFSRMTNRIQNNNSSSGNSGQKKVHKVTSNYAPGRNYASASASSKPRKTVDSEPLKTGETRRVSTRKEEEK